MLGWCATAAAQTVAAAPTAGSDPLAEIVVTAERRHTNLQTTPISATVISGGDLANLGVVAEVDALQFATPGAVIDNFGQGNDFSIRGVGKGGTQFSDDRGRRHRYPRRRGNFPGCFGEPALTAADVESSAAARHVRRPNAAAAAPYW